jgi:hypothetical protein
MTRAMIVLVLALATIPASARAQDWSWPEHPENLQVLPENTGPQELRMTMGMFVRGLGVRCTFCHVGEEGQPLSTYDFPSDSNSHKVTARTMLGMLSVIRDSVATVERGEHGEPVEVGCWTCHRGRPRPTTLEQELREAYHEGEIDAALAHYHELREQFYGRGTLDFGERSLNAFGYELLGEGKAADAVAVFRLNAEQFPESGNVWDSLGEGLLAAGQREEAIEAYEKSLELDPENDNAREKLREIRGE